MSNANLQQKIRDHIRDVPNFPKPGILFKDVSPILKNAQLVDEITDAFAHSVKDLPIDAIAAVESRGYYFAPLLSQKLNLPFFPIRKAGKLPGDVAQQSYSLEYGSATIEVQKDAFEPNDRVLIHDDLLATGGTALAAAQLVKKLGGQVAGFTFLVNLNFLEGHGVLESLKVPLISLVDYN